MANLPAGGGRVTSSVAVGGLALELPREWTPVIDADGYVDRTLTDAWAAYTAEMPETDGRAAWFIQQRWFLLLFRLWREDVLELAERALKPGAPLEPIDIYPPALRHPENFGMPHEGLMHLRSGRVHYAFCYRLRAPQPPDVTTGLPLETAALQPAELEPAPGQAMPEAPFAGDPASPPAPPKPGEFVAAYLALKGKRSKRGLYRARDAAGLRGTPQFGNANLLRWWPADVEKNQGGPGSKG